MPEVILSIEEEAALCRKAFEDDKSIRLGNLVGQGNRWVLFQHYHHGSFLESGQELFPYSEPESRIDFILKYKKEEERAARLHWMRPLNKALMVESPPWKRMLTRLHWYEREELELHPHRHLDKDEMMELHSILCKCPFDLEKDIFGKGPEDWRGAARRSAVMNWKY